MIGGSLWVLSSPGEGHKHHPLCSCLQAPAAHETWWNWQPSTKIISSLSIHHKPWARKGMRAKESSPMRPTWSVFQAWNKLSKDTVQTLEGLRTKSNVYWAWPRASWCSPPQYGSTSPAADRFSLIKCTWVVDHSYNLLLATSVHVQAGVVEHLVNCDKSGIIGRQWHSTTTTPCSRLCCQRSGGRYLKGQ